MYNVDPGVTGTSALVYPPKLVLFTQLAPPCAPHTSIVSTVTPAGTTKVCGAPVKLNVSRIDTRQVLFDTGAGNVTTLPQEDGSLVVLTEEGQVMVTHCEMPAVANNIAMLIADKLCFICRVDLCCVGENTLFQR
jgi:hypothetical protein